MINYNYENLSEMIGETVQVKDKQGSAVKLKVAEVNKGTIDGKEWESFSVIYNGEINMSIPQGTYTFCHENIGEISLFTTPNSATEYETIVNRKRENTDR